MAVETDATRSATFFKLGDPGVTSASFAGLVNPVVGSFNESYVTVNEVEMLAPVFTCNESEVDTVRMGTEVEIGSSFYRVVNVRPDGFGLAVLVLEEQ